MQLRYKTVKAFKLMVVLFLVLGIAYEHPIFPNFHQHNLKPNKFICKIWSHPEHPNINRLSVWPA